MKEKIKYILETNKIGFIVGCIIFAVLFIYFSFLTINAFSGGAIAGQKSEEYKLGECKYGKITYYGNVDENGLPSGEGRFTAKDGGKVIEVIANVNGNDFDVELINVTDYDEHYNTVITGDFDLYDVNKVSDATIRHEDINGNYGMWYGSLDNKQLTESGEVYYMLYENDKGYARIGNFIDGKMTTIQYSEDIVISEIPPEEEIEE